MFAREKNRLQTMNIGQRNTKLEKNVGFLMIFAKNSGLNEKKMGTIYLLTVILFAAQTVPYFSINMQKSAR